jgi:hypothetical protein
VRDGIIVAILSVDEKPMAITRKEMAMIQKNTAPVNRHPQAENEPISREQLIFLLNEDLAR